jgi:hypothetical protein
MIRLAHNRRADWLGVRGFDRKARLLGNMGHLRDIIKYNRDEKHIFYPINY